MPPHPNTITSYAAIAAPFRELTLGFHGLADNPCHRPGSRTSAVEVERHGRGLVYS